MPFDHAPGVCVFPSGFRNAAANRRMGASSDKTVGLVGVRERGVAGKKHRLISVELRDKQVAATVVDEGDPSAAADGRSVLQRERLLPGLEVGVDEVADQQTVIYVDQNLQIGRLDAHAEAVRHEELVSL